MGNWLQRLDCHLLASDVMNRMDVHWHGCKERRGRTTSCGMTVDLTPSCMLVSLHAFDSMFVETYLECSLAVDWRVSKSLEGVLSFREVC